MKLVASVIAKNELGRYLKPCITALRGFCDEVRVLDDGSADGSAAWLKSQPHVEVLVNPATSFDEHEGDARNCLLEWTLCADPTHVLAIDADEFIAEPAVIRGVVDSSAGDVWTLTMQEVWKATPEALWTREDGGWRSHEVPILYRVPDVLSDAWWISDMKLACGREPMAVQRGQRWATGTQVLHFGWTNPAQRQARYERYQVLDGGQYHASAHLESILWPELRVALAEREWPGELASSKDAILAAAG